MTSSSPWFERQLVAFERATEHRTLQLLKAIAIYAREEHDDARGAYEIYVEQIVQQDGVDADLVLETAPAAWAATEDHRLFRPITAGHTTLDLTIRHDYAAGE